MYHYYIIKRSIEGMIVFYHRSLYFTTVSRKRFSEIFIEMSEVDLVTKVASRVTECQVELSLAMSALCLLR